ncbi:concanavalin A-like lectin/glucanase domain-containing protein [Phaeosphaeriaceae sp. PMI808]|nr:concanavalin A-like lectin/glucanase domain-containing protein [Phaeosphaeriaceae sp. PMI808]
MHFSALVSAAALFEFSIAGYVLEDDYMPDFYSKFDFFTGADPTDGFVKYVDEATARKSNLINGSSTSLVQFGVDIQNKTPKGRPSIRIESKKKYDGGLIVLDLEHMPFGCGTWPAFWTLGPNWPKGGEIDILEGVNDFTNNGMTLHTSPGCKIGPDTTQFSGSVTTPDCDVNAKNQSKNVGCSIQHPSEQSYGAGLNQNGGGVYATSWNADAISIYFFPRGSVPADVLGDNPNPKAWGKPAAKFQGGCDIDKMFAEQKIIIDTTFCGQWAGKIWDEGSCASKAKTCEEYVRDNPEAFAEAYWEINALKVYKNDGTTVPAPSAPVPSAPGKPSQSIPISAPAPLPTANSSLPVPPGSSKTILPIPSSKPIPGTPPKPTSPPVVPVPSSVAAAPSLPSSAPQSSRTQGGPGSVRPSRTIESQVNAPTGKFGMPGWQWPVGVGNKQPGAAPSATTSAASAPNPSSAPAQQTTGAAVAPTSPQNVAPPSNLPIVPAQPSPVPTLPALPVNPPAQPGVAPPEAPAVSDVGPVRTVYQTVYKTVTADPEATPAPGAKKARMARMVKEHRRRWTRHNARP